MDIRTMARAALCATVLAGASLVSACGGPDPVAVTTEKTTTTTTGPAEMAPPPAASTTTTTTHSMQQTP